MSICKRLAAAVAALAVCASADAQTLDQQERCSMLAKQAFQKIYAEESERAKQESQVVGANVDAVADYQSHFNTQIGKCLMIVDITRDEGYYLSCRPCHAFSHDISLTDPIENRQYASYVGKHGHNDIAETCELTPRFGVKTYCKTKQEFDAYVRNYLEE